MAATQPSPPPASAADDDQPKPKPPELVQPDAKPDTSPFVNSEPIREDQVENAIKFLSHPRVRGSPVIHRRSFLEKKGLTKEEIDEAFRRVPDLPPSSQPATTNQDGQMKPASSVPTQVPAPVPQPAPGPVVSRVGVLSPSRFHWYHAVLAVGFLAASGAGTAVLIKNAIIPRLKSWIRKVVLEEEEDDLVKKPDMKPSLAEETAAAAKAAAAAASDAAKASQEMLSSRNEEGKHFEELMKLLDVQVREMKSMKISIQTLEGHANNSVRTNFADQEDYRFSNSISKDIDDRPPNPNQQSSSNITKPWEVGQVGNGSNFQGVESQAMREALGYKVQEDYGVKYLGDENAAAAAAVPWWQRKNPRITEIDSEMVQGNGGRSNGTTVKQQRTWVPPQPPPVAIPESAEAIRRPKPSSAKEAGAGKQGQEELGENHQLVSSQTSNVSDELQRMTNVSESGGEILEREQE